MSKFDVPVEIVNWCDVKDIKSSVYVIVNKYMIGCYKVGYTNRESGSLETRIKEQERSEWVIPGSLRCLIVVDTDYPELLEHKMHTDPDMARKRISNKRELFCRNINEIYKELLSHSMGIANKIYIIRDVAATQGFKEIDLNVIKKEYSESTSTYRNVNSLGRYIFKKYDIAIEFEVICCNQTNRGLKRVVKYDNREMTFNKFIKKEICDKIGRRNLTSTLIDRYCEKL